jgi:quercetin dioxygenase-like cupin family protein
MFIRIFTGPDGESHFEDLPLDQGEVAPPAQDALSIHFSRLQPGYTSGWHTAPRRQYVIGITGEVELATGDGSTRRFKPGDVLLADDLTGHGHTTTVVGNEMRISAQIPLRVDPA